MCTGVICGVYFVNIRCVYYEYYRYGHSFHITTENRTLNEASHCQLVLCQVLVKTVIYMYYVWHSWKQVRLVCHT